MKRSASLIFIVILSFPAYPESLDVSANAGVGVAERDSFGLRAVPSVGASLRAAVTAHHRLQFDYAFGHLERETPVGGFAPSIHNRHFFTGSYVLQSATGRVRPFLQIGAGVQRETNNDNEVIRRDLYATAHTSLAGVAGAGLTVRITRGLFIRPQVRVWFANNETHDVKVTAIPSVSVGWQF